MNTNLSEEEYKKLRESPGEVSDEQLERERTLKKKQEEINSMSARAFLTARTEDVIEVPVLGLGGTKYIKIRARLSRSEMKRHKPFAEMSTKISQGDDKLSESEEYIKGTAAFLANITIDPDLDEEFWLDDSVDPLLTQQLIYAYFTEPSKSIEEIASFR